MIPRQTFSILCVDDDEAILKMLERVLASGGYSPEVAANGFLALAKITKQPHHFRLVITDLRMPGLDGFELIERARMAGFDGEFMVLAASIGPDQRARLQELRVGRILEKPSRPAEVLAAVRQAQTGH
jgi:CheY-like chemotaxis protein